jgi:glycosyltransferase involved in cell wall biosynthesis
VIDAPLVSLLVCTYNRAYMLGPTLESLLCQEFGWGAFEIIVIDNASTDNTRAVVEAIAARDARVRYFHEPQLGVAIARNTGAQVSRARYIAYFDDDLIAEPGCLHQLIAPFFEQVPAPAAVMGKVDLRWETRRPAWFPPRYEPLLSRFDLGDTPRRMLPGEYLITMNVALNRATFLGSGGIREDLSRKGRMFICSGDNELFNRYMQLQLAVFYQPAALVHHLVPASRQRRTWLFKRVLGEGTSQVIARYAGAPRAMLLRRLLYDGKILGRLGLRGLLSGLRRERAQAFEALIAIIEQLGKLSAELQLLAGRRRVVTLSE